MAVGTNQITVEFTECSPAPANGYEIRYRPAGDAGSFRDAGNFVSSPAVFEDATDELGTEYEGDIRSDCGGGVFGNWIPWDTGSPVSTANGNWTYDNLVGLGGRFKIIVDGVIEVNVTTSGSGSIDIPLGVLVEVIVNTTLSGTATTDISGPYTNSTSNDHITNDEFTSASGTYSIDGVSNA